MCSQQQLEACQKEIQRYECASVTISINSQDNKSIGRAEYVCGSMNTPGCWFPHALTNLASMLLPQQDAYANSKMFHAKPTRVI